jgi:hypothetical protein
MGIQEILPLLLEGAAAIVILVGGYGYLRKTWSDNEHSAQQTTIEELKNLVDALNGKVQLLESERNEAKLERDHMKLRLEAVEYENGVLRSIVTGEVRMEKIEAKVDAVVAHVAEIKTLLKTS